MFPLRNFLFFSVGILFLTGCTRPYLHPESAPLQEASLDEIRALYQQEREASPPPLLGLVEVVIREKGRFWAKWKSNAQGITLKGFNLVGGTLFDFEVQRAGTGEEEIHFTTADSRQAFHGSRQAFQDRMAQAEVTGKHLLRTEGLTLLNWIARGSVPDLSGPMTLEKRQGLWVLDRFAEDGAMRLTQRLLIEQRQFRVTEVFFFDSGVAPLRMILNDYRRLDRPSFGRVNTISSLPVGDFLFPFHIVIETDNFHGEATFMEIHVDARHSPPP